MAFRFSLTPPKTLGELFERVRELLPQIEVKVLASREIGTSETPIAHGLRSVPIFVRTSNPHCIAVIRKTKNPDDKCVYFRATNPCVADVWVVAIGSIGKRQVENGGYRYPDWDPAGDATGDHKFAIDAADEAADGADYAETKIVAGSGTSIAKITGSHGKALSIACTVTGPLKSELLPLPDGVAALGNEGRWADGQHVHPLVRPSKIRYYLSDTHGTGEYTGHLLVTTNPYDEANAIDFQGASEWEVFVSNLGSPGVSVWQGGVVHAHLRVKLVNPQVGRTYRLYTGNGDIVYTAMIWDWTHSDTYQVKESAPGEPSITTDYATLDFDLPVAALSAGTDGRLGLNMRLRVFAGSDEATFSNEKIVIRIGGDNASYLDTLFTPDGGFSGVHNDLDGREAANCHPMSAITPGRVLTPTTDIVATSSGLFAIPSNSNFAKLSGTEDIVGCSTAGWIIDSEMEFMVMEARKILRSQTVADGYAGITWGYSDTGYAADYDVMEMRPYAVVRCRWIGSVWRVCSVMNV